MTGKYVRFDWALKHILRQKENFEILEGFVSELIKDDVKIQKILESESNKAHKDEKKNSDIKPEMRAKGLEKAQIRLDMISLNMKDRDAYRVFMKKLRDDSSYQFNNRV